MPNGLYPQPGEFTGSGHYVRAILKTHLELDAPESPGFWAGAFLILTGLIYHLLSAFIQLRHAYSGQAKSEKHDALVYKGLRESLSDQWFGSFLDLLGGDHSYHKSDSALLFQSIRYLGLPSNQFLIADLKTSSEALRDALSKLGSFLVVRFFVYPEGQPPGGDTRYCMQPRHNVDRDWDGSIEKMQKYEEWTAELDGLINSAWESYRSFTACIHEKLGEAAIFE
jgi:hypothetical protein